MTVALASAAINGWMTNGTNAGSFGVVGAIGTFVLACIMTACINHPDYPTKTGFKIATIIMWLIFGFIVFGDGWSSLL